MGYPDPDHPERPQSQRHLYTDGAGVHADLRNHADREFRSRRVRDAGWLPDALLRPVFPRFAADRLTPVRTSRGNAVAVPGASRAPAVLSARIPGHDRDPRPFDHDDLSRGHLLRCQPAVDPADLFGDIRARPGPYPG